MEPVLDCNRYYSELVLHANSQYLNFIILNTRKFYNLHMGGHKSIRRPLPLQIVANILPTKTTGLMIQQTENA